MAQNVGSSSALSGKVLALVVPSTAVGALLALMFESRPEQPLIGALAFGVAFLVAFVCSVGLARRLGGSDVPLRVGGAAREPAVPRWNDLEPGEPGHSGAGRTRSERSGDERSSPHHLSPELSCPEPSRAASGRAGSEIRDQRGFEVRAPRGSAGPLTHVPVGEQQWWEAPPRRRSSAGSGDATRPTVRSLHDYEFRPQIASCPNCNGFALDVAGRPGRPEYTFTCRDCRCATTWLPGSDWPPIRHDIR